MFCLVAKYYFVALNFCKKGEGDVMEFKEGNIVQGKITGIQSYGVFVRLSDTCSGLVHISEMPKFVLENPQSFFKIGQIVSVKILRIKGNKTQAILRIHRSNFDNFYRKRFNASHFETKSGFEPLKDNLSVWIHESLGCNCK